MEHLPIHLPYEAELGGPVHYRWMYPFERLMFDLKKKVKNLNRVEGSIVHQSLNEETSNLAEYYFPGHVRTKKRRPSRHDDGGEKPVYYEVVPEIFMTVGRLSGKSSSRALTSQEYSHIHAYIVNNIDELEELRSIYKAQVTERYPSYSEDKVIELLEKEFTKWLHFYVNSSISQGATLPMWLVDIVNGPFTIVKTYTRYSTRGYAFRVYDGERGKKTTDSGVATTAGEVSYYGILREIIEVTYPGGIGIRCVAFNCDWYDPINGTEVDEFGVTTVHRKRRLTKYDPFILGNQADQVCYLSIPTTRVRKNPWLVVVRISPRGVIFNQSDIPPFQENEEVQFSVHEELIVDLTVDGVDDVHQVSEEEGDELDTDTDSIASGSEDESE